MNFQKHGRHAPGPRIHSSRVLLVLFALLWVTVGCSQPEKTMPVQEQDSPVIPSPSVEQAFELAVPQLQSSQSYETVEIELSGPGSVGMGTPNPFMIDVDVTFSGPESQTYTIPGFYDGDGSGGMDGDIWKARFVPDSAGTWTYSSSSSEPSLDGESGSFEVTGGQACQAYLPGGLPDLPCVGRLEYVGDHFLKFKNGTYWLKGGRQ